MLEGTQPLDYERAVFITENAFHDNQYTYESYRSALDLHSAIIERLMQANSGHDWQQFKKTSLGIPLETDAETQEKYRKALANWAIFTYLTDTLQFKLDSATVNHLPFTYTTEDPFGSSHWQNTQTINLLETQRGNCYALAVLFKLLADRFDAVAHLVTAPQHVYIQHRDPKGDLYNVELATRSFPGTGTIQTLTYTTREAQLNNLALRSLDAKQSVALCLVYLAKGYEHRYGTPHDAFVMACADKALEHDVNNLNALLLKAQVLEQRVMTQQMPAAQYETLLADLYKRGYRQMPDDMQAIIVAAIEGAPVTPTENKTPNPFENIGADARYVTLSHGVFEELHKPQKQVRYGHTIFDAEAGKVVEFVNGETIRSFDPVVFALSVDPLMHSYPWYTPYQFAGNSPIEFIDLDGLEPKRPAFEWNPTSIKNYGYGVMMKVEGWWVFKQYDDQGNIVHKFYQNGKWSQFTPAKPERLAPTLAKGLYAVYIVGGGVATAELGIFGFFLRETGEAVVEEATGIPIVPIYPDPSDALDPFINRSIKNSLSNLGKQFEEQMIKKYEKKIIKKNEEIFQNGKRVTEIDFETEEAIFEVGLSLDSKMDKLHLKASIAEQRKKKLIVIYDYEKTPAARLNELQESLKNRWGSRVSFVPDKLEE